MTRTLLAWLLGTLVGMVAWSNAAGAEPALAELQSLIDALRARIAELQNRQWTLDDEQIARTIDRVLADAGRRSQLLDVEGFTAGHDGKNFVLRSADGRYVFKPGLLFQFRHVLDFRHEATSDGDDAITKGFEIRRTQFIASGNACSPDLTYWFMFEAGKDGKLGLQDAYMTYKFGQPWFLKVGQYFDPVSHELRVGPPRRLAVEPSVADFLIGGGLQDRVQGVSLIYGNYDRDTAVNVEIAAHDGIKSRNTNFTDLGTNYGFAGRAEFKCFGDWPSYRDFTAAGNRSDLLVFAAAADYTDAPGRQIILAQIDAQYETGPLALYGALLCRRIDFRNTTEDDAQFDFGGVATVAYMVTEHCEVFARYSLTRFERAVVGDEDTIHEICVGANWYAIPSAAQRWKVTIDCTYLPTGAPASLKPFGIQGGTDEGEFVFRAQVRLLI